MKLRSNHVRLEKTFIITMVKDTPLLSEYINMTPKPNVSNDNKRKSQRPWRKFNVLK